MKKNITIIVLIIIILVGGAYFLGRNSKEIKEPGENALQQNTENNVINVPANNVVSDCLPTTAPWIKVLSPNGGETYTPGQQILVKWKSCNVLEPIYLTLHRQDQNKTLQGNNDNGSIYPWTLGTDGTVNDGSEQVILPSSSDSNLIYGKHYYVSITSSENHTVAPPVWAIDNSDNLFTITNVLKNISNSYNTYLVPDKFSFSYDKDAQIEVPPLVNALSDQTEAIKVFSGKTEERISWEKDGSKFNPDGINPATLIGNETFGRNVYKVYKVTSEYTPVRILGYYYVLLYSNNEAIIIYAGHNANVPMLIDLASVGFE